MVDHRTIISLKSLCLRICLLLFLPFFRRDLGILVRKSDQQEWFLRSHGRYSGPRGARSKQARSSGTCQLPVSYMSSQNVPGSKWFHLLPSLRQVTCTQTRESTRLKYPRGSWSPLEDCRSPTGPLLPLDLGPGCQLEDTPLMTPLPFPSQPCPRRDISIISFLHGKTIIPLGYTCFVDLTAWLSKRG